MTESTLNSKGQTTVPQPIRDALHALPGTKLRWHLLPDGAIMVRAKTKSLSSMAGQLQTPKIRRVRAKDMNA